MPINVSPTHAEPTTLDIRLLGSATVLEPFAANNSASRSAMRSSFYKQKLVLSGSTARRNITGAEREYGKYTMAIKMPADGRIVRIVHKYPKGGVYAFKHNPETTIIYEDQYNGELGCVIVPAYYCNHKVFGFHYVPTRELKNLTVGTYLAKGTILANSPSVKNNGDYHYGIETNVAFMAVPGIIEDGIVVSDTYCERTRTRGYGEKVFEWGQDHYPLNTYGKTDDEYKIFPDIGERVREDGVLFAMREYDPILAVCHMTKEALRQIDHTFDKITYISLSSVDSDDMPIVENINVLRTHNPDLWKTPVRMENQIQKYHHATKVYHTEINGEYEKKKRQHRGLVKTSKQYHNLLVQCRKNDNMIERVQLKKSVVRTFRRQKLDDWRIEVHYGWNITPTIGAKLSDSYGGKGVICAIWPEANMPVNKNGVRADVIVDPNNV